MKRIFSQLLIISVIVSMISPLPSGNATFVPPKSSVGEKLDFVFLLHANQANVPYGDVANDLCYYPVMETLLRHPDLHFTLHFSGTLLTDLAWFNQSTLNFLREGINTNQFEMLGSTYSQNIIYSMSDDYDNELQIEVHQQTLDEILDVNPTGFWNPERCWNQTQYVPLMTEAGYEYTFIEEHILKDSTSVSGFDAFKMRQTSVNGQNLLIFNDNTTILDMVDLIGNTTEPATDLAVISAVDDLIDYLYSIYEADVDDDYCVVYAQDMEAWGLWQEESHPLDTVAQTVERLAYLFTRLENETSWLQVVTPTEFRENLPVDYTPEIVANYVDGTANWMIIPSQNEGFTDWFDFNSHDSRLIDFRQQFDLTRARLRLIDDAITSLGETQNVSQALKLLNYAKFVYTAHQFEFGCIGCYFPWYYGTNLALLSAEAALYSLDPSPEPETLVADWDLDGNSEFILRDTKNLFIFAGQGGRLINWFDIEAGRVLLGNDVPSTYSGVSGQNYPDGTPLSTPIEEIQPMDLWGRTEKSYSIRQKAFVDGFIGETPTAIWNSRNRSSTISSTEISFAIEYLNRIFTKTYSIVEGSSALQIAYSYTNQGSQGIQPTIGLAFTPDNLDMLFKGKEGLDFISVQEDDSTSAFLNNNNTFTSIKLQIPDNKLESIESSTLNMMFASDFLLVLPAIESGDTFEISLVLETLEIYPTFSSTPPEENTIALSLVPVLFTFWIGIVFVVRRQQKKENDQ
ncbi:MAG: hypothetical protein ACTSWW_05935 [Promethearchaeota archaeon]